MDQKKENSVSKCNLPKDDARLLDLSPKLTQR